MTTQRQLKESIEQQLVLGDHEGMTNTIDMLLRVQNITLLTVKSIYDLEAFVEQAAAVDKALAENTVEDMTVPPSGDIPTIEEAFGPMDSDVTDQ